MANELKGLPQHSADYFGDARDYWWRRDQLEMVMRSWSVERMTEVLDVGCGIGHWGRALLPLLPPSARLVGVDREELWIQEATARASRAGLGERCSYRPATAEALPFADGTFDLVTCQTLLMHVPDPGRVLVEMVRVLRPSGLLVAAESANVAEPLVDSFALDEAPELTASLLHFLLVCQRGIRKLGLGDHLIGEALPGWFQRAGLQGIDVRLCDRAWALLPPYASAFEQAQLDDIEDAAERELAPWDEATTCRYFLAGGGTPEAFSRGWAASLDQRRRVRDAVRAGTFSRAGGGFFYLVSGRRPL